MPSVGDRGRASYNMDIARRHGRVRHHVCCPPLNNPSNKFGPGMSLADLQIPADDLFPAEADAPFRSQVLGYDHLVDLARTVAAQWPAAVRPGAHALLRRLKDNEQVLHDARAEAARAADAREPLTPDAEWLLDNFFVIEEVLREVRRDLPRGYYDELPLVTTGPWAGLPRIYALAVALITHTDSHLEDPENSRPAA